MRKLILISALLLASASVQAGEFRSLTLAANDEPKAIETVKPAEPAKVDETKTEAVKSDTAKTDTAKIDTSKAQASKPAKKTHARRWEGDEAKARRIAARYGVYW
jgi:hypothetical protein